MSQWAGVDGGESKWKLANGAMQEVPRTGNIRTRRAFGDCQLHIEWRTPAEVKDTDHRVLVTEVRHLMPSAGTKGEYPDVEPARGILIAGYAPEVAERRFMSRFNELTA